MNQLLLAIWQSIVQIDTTYSCVFVVVVIWFEKKGKKRKRKKLLYLSSTMAARAAKTQKSKLAIIGPSGVGKKTLAKSRSKSSTY